jgi:hypothetical protein
MSKHMPSSNTAMCIELVQLAQIFCVTFCDRNLQWRHELCLIYSLLLCTFVFVFDLMIFREQTISRATVINQHYLRY